MAPTRSSTTRACGALVFAVGSIAAFGSSAWPLTLRNIDQSAKDPSFVKYRKEMWTALSEDDVDAYVRMTDPRIKFAYGRDLGVGRELFRQYLTGRKATCGVRSNKGGSYYRSHLHRMLTQGGVFRNDGKTFETGVPLSYLYRKSYWRRSGSKKPPKAPSKAIPLSSYIPVRLKPESEAKPVEHLSTWSVQLGNEEVLARTSKDRRVVLWRSISLANGRTGWLCADDYYEVMGYRASFEKKNGRWWMVEIKAIPR